MNCVALSGRRVRAHGLQVWGGCSWCRPGALTRRFRVTPTQPSIFLNQDAGFQQRRRAANQEWSAFFLVENLPTERPVLRTLHQAVTHRIQTDIFPFARFAFAGTEFVVVKTGLPTPRACKASEFVRGSRGDAR